MFQMFFIIVHGLPNMYWWPGLVTGQYTSVNLPD